MNLRSNAPIMTEKTLDSAIRPLPPVSETANISNVKSRDRANNPVSDRNPARITSSSIAISWSIILLVLLVFFNKYIAYYQPETIGDITNWVRYPVLTEAFNRWLPIAIAALLFFIAGHVVLIYRDSYLRQEIILGVLNLFAITSIISLILIFPFDFSALPSADIAITGILSIFVRVGLIGVAVIFAVGTLVRFIRLAINLALHKV
ncbi:hypothetical protein ACFLYF_02830 [Chloroflexota bacterium]